MRMMGLFSKVIVSCKDVLIQRQPWNTYRAYASGFLMSIFSLIDSYSFISESINALIFGLGKTKALFSFQTEFT